MAMMRNVFGLTIHSETQGFMLSDGQFAGRIDALRVAEAADQILDASNLRAGRLFSEDVW